MKRLKKAIVLTLIFFSVSIFGITLLPNYVQANDENTNAQVQDEEYENYSEDYKKYLALSDEAKANYIAIPHKYDVTMNEYTATKEIFDRKNHGLMKSAQSLLTANLSSSFDLRSKINIRVENQNPYGLCWDYATMGTLRTYTALRGISKANDGYTNDFSEWHINVLTSRLYPSKGYNRYTGDGGNFCDCEKYFRYNDGPVWEERYPFGSSIPSDSAGLKALDDMTPNIFVHQTIDFPSVDKRKESGVTKMYVGDKEISASEMKEIRNQVKSHIVTNGGVYCSIRTNDNFIGNNLGAPYNTYSGKYSQYDDGSIAGENCGGHAVTIIGWDDNYNRMNFYAKNKNGEIVHPTSNGAWLILNSYGPDAFEAGCQWVSYEDAKVEADLHGILKADKIAQKVKYTLKNKNVYSVLKKAFETEGADMIASDSAMTIEVYDIAIDGIISLNFSECEMTDEDAREVFKNPFPKLKYLNLNYNKLTTIEPILVNTNLINLDVDCNAQTQLDVTGISGLKNIKWLNLNSNKSLKSYSEVFKLLKLRNLFLYNDNIVSISGVKNLTDLESLVLGKNSIVDVSEIGNLKNLVRLELSSNKIEDISKLTPKQYSTKFTIDGQKITKTISNTISSYSYPDIIKKAKLSSSEVYSSDGLEFTNCSENSAGKGIVLNNGKGIAKVKVKSGLANNTTLTLVPILSTITVISPDAGTYKAGEEILITATYNEDVYKLSDSSLVTLDAQSAPVLKIKFGNGSEKNTIFRSATSNASSKTTVIVYSYKIVSGDNGEISISSYTGTVYGTDKTGYSVQKLENTGKKIVADTVAPQLQTINVTSPAKGVYAKGQTITLVATFDENVYGTNNKGSIAASNAPVMKIKFGTGSEKQATFDSANGSKIIYKYTIANNDNGKLTTSSYTGNVFDAVGNSRTVANVTIGGNEIYSDTSIPQLQSINVTSPESGTYKAGQTITMVATFSEKLYGTNNKGAITASNAPVLKIKFGNGSEKQATFASAGEKTITYTYKVVTGDTGKLASTNYTGKVYSEMGQECNV
ncbi:MAG: hypothetical protein J6N78_02195, partial [Clostridia bacterium]|nr:hypothetical protein [Clostridia bacterium]